MKKRYYILLVLIAIAIGGSVAYASHALQLQTTKAKISQVVVQKPTIVESPKSKYDVGSPDPQEILELVNQERERVGVKPLTVDLRLVASAQAKADDMAKNDYFAHSDANGKHGYEYIRESMPGVCVYQSENIFLNEANKIPQHVVYITSRGTVDDWLGSKPHAAAIRDSKYLLTGVAVAVNGYKTYVVEHFCQLP